MSTNPEKPWCSVKDPAAWGIKVGTELQDIDAASDKTGRAIVSSIRDGYVYIRNVDDS